MANNPYVNKVQKADGTVLIDLTRDTVAAESMLSGVTAHRASGESITGNIANKSSSDLSVSGDTVTVPAGYYASQATASVDAGSTTVAEPTIDSSTGIVTAEATVTAGYQSAGTESNTLQLTTQGATTYNVSTSERSISAGTYLTGNQTIRAVTTSNISAANIRDGITITVGDAGSSTRIKNVTGTYTDASTVSSGQTAATAAQIYSGYSAWVDGVEVKGSASTYDQGKADGWTAAYNKWSYPSSGTTSSFKVGWPGSTYDTLTERTYTLSVDSSYAYLKYGSTTYARVSNSPASSAYSDGWAAAYGKVSIPGSGTSSSMTVKTPPSTVDGTATSTSFTVSVDNSYAYIKKGSTTVARVSNTAYANGWSGCYDTITLNATGSTTVAVGTAGITVRARAKASPTASSLSNVPNANLTVTATN